jgi:hypothetical protein
MYGWCSDCGARRCLLSAGPPGYLTSLYDTACLACGRRDAYALTDEDRKRLREDACRSQAAWERSRDPLFGDRRVAALEHLYVCELFDHSAWTAIGLVDSGEAAQTWLGEPWDSPDRADQLWPQ